MNNERNDDIEQNCLDLLSLNFFSGKMKTKGRKDDPFFHWNWISLSYMKQCSHPCLWWRGKVVTPLQWLESWLCHLCTRTTPTCHYQSQHRLDSCVTPPSHVPTTTSLYPGLNGPDWAGRAIRQNQSINKCTSSCQAGGMNTYMCIYVY